MFVFTLKAKILAISLTLIGLVMLIIGFNTTSVHSLDLHEAAGIVLAEAPHGESSP